jgi:hypothetical protein
VASVGIDASEALRIVEAALRSGAPASSV